MLPKKFQYVPSRSAPRKQEVSFYSELHRILIEKRFGEIKALVTKFKDKTYGKAIH
jgi:hypothetical protein